MTVSVDITGLTAGDYTGMITIASDDADNSPQIVLVTLSLVSPHEYYVSTTGNDDTGTGTIDAPLATPNRALQEAHYGDSIILRDQNRYGQLRATQCSP